MDQPRLEHGSNIAQKNFNHDLRKVQIWFTYDIYNRVHSNSLKTTSYNFDYKIYKITMTNTIEYNDQYNYDTKAKRINGL